MDRRQIARISGWQDMRSAFRWRLPAHFNIAAACCDSWAAVDPNRLAVIHVGADGATAPWSYGRLRDASDRLAGALAAVGIGPGDRVAILHDQHPVVLVSHFAAHKLGAISLPIFTAFGPDALRYRLLDSGAKAAIAADHIAAVIRGLDLPDLGAVFSLGDAPPGTLPLWEAAKRASPLGATALTGPDDPAMMIYTSGTTGPPKGVLNAHRFLLGHLPSMELHHEGFPQPGDRGWTPADWAWIGGLMDMAMPCLYYGVPLISCRFEKFDPLAAVDLIRRFRLTNLFMPPTALKLMRAAGVQGDFGLRAIGSGGESLGADLLTWGRDALDAPINEIYGQTECNLVMASCRGTMEVRPGSLGLPVPGHDVVVLDAAGAPVSAGTLGEIAVRAPDPVMFLKYWNQPEKTAEKFRDGWLMTGDLGTCDADGYITYQGRNDDLISSAGYRIGPTEIENCLTGHGDVLLAAAVGQPDPLRGQVVKAFVTLRASAQPTGIEAELIARVRDQVSPHVAPRAVEVIETMPMTTTGKIMRRALRDRSAT
ncbi:MAG: AMP-binding protein [Pseudomonadota bacterium]